MDLDKLTQDMTEYYTDQINQVIQLAYTNLQIQILSPQNLHSLTTLAEGDIVATRFSDDPSYYRARVVAYTEDSYDCSLSTVDLDFVDFGDCEEKSILEVYEIKTDYLRLKFQAVQCSLAKLR